MLNAQGLRFVSHEIEICTCASALLNKNGPLAFDAGDAHVGLADAHADQEQEIVEQLIDGCGHGAECLRQSLLQQSRASDREETAHIDLRVEIAEQGLGRR